MEELILQTVGFLMFKILTEVCFNSGFTKCTIILELAVQMEISWFVQLLGLQISSSTCQKALSDDWLVCCLPERLRSDLLKQIMAEMMISTEKAEMSN